MTALTVEELMAWNQSTAEGWRRLGTQHPELLTFPCDIRETSNVGELLQHIVAVELRYTQRLHSLAETAYEELPLGSAEIIYTTHDKAVRLLQYLLTEKDDAWWEQSIEFLTRSAGKVRSTRRTVLVHLLMHSIRHYAQLATIARHHGVRPDWPMDYLFMHYQPAS